MEAKETDRKVRRNDMILTSALLLAALCVLLWVQTAKKPESGSRFLLVISSDGKEIIREEITGSKELNVLSPGGGYNVIEVFESASGYGIRCKEADCPEHTCMEQGLVTLPDEPIVCLPHKMTAKMITVP